MFFIVIFGFGLPVGMVVLIYRYQKAHGQQTAFDTFNFLMSGYTRKSWYWESVILLRKLVIVIVMVFIPNIELQTVSGGLVLVVSVVLNVFVQPFTYSSLVHLESVTLWMLVTALSLTMLSHRALLCRALLCRALLCTLQHTALTQKKNGDQNNILVFFFLKLDRSEL